MFKQNLLSSTNNVDQIQKTTNYRTKNLQENQAQKRIKQEHLPMSYLFVIPSHQQEGEYARALRRVTQVKKKCLEVTMKCH